MKTYEAIGGVGRRRRPARPARSSRWPAPRGTTRTTTRRPTPTRRRNRAIADRFEPGSVMKVFTIAERARGQERRARRLDLLRGGDDGDRQRRHPRHPRQQVAHGHADPQHLVATSAPPRSRSASARRGSTRASAASASATPRASPSPASRWACSARTATPGCRSRRRRRRYGQGISVTTLQLAMAMSAIANDGRLLEPVLVKRVTDGTGVTLSEAAPHVRRDAVPPHVAQLDVRDAGRRHRGRGHRRRGRDPRLQGRRQDGDRAEDRSGDAQVQRHALRRVVRRLRPRRQARGSPSRSCSTTRWAAPTRADSVAGAGLPPHRRDGAALPRRHPPGERAHEARRRSPSAPGTATRPRTPYQVLGEARAPEPPGGAADPVGRAPTRSGEARVPDLAGPARARGRQGRRRRSGLAPARRGDGPPLAPGAARRARCCPRGPPSSSSSSRRHDRSRQTSRIRRRGVPAARVAASVPITLRELVREIPDAALARPRPRATCASRGVHHDSRRVEPGDLFVARARARAPPARASSPTRRRAARRAVLVERGRRRPTPGAARVEAADVPRGARASPPPPSTGTRPSRSRSSASPAPTARRRRRTWCRRRSTRAARRAGIVGTLGYRFADLDLPATHTSPEADDLARIAAADARARRLAPRDGGLVDRARRAAASTPSASASPPSRT